MHRIDGPGATEDGRFTDGNPAAGIPPTIVTDDWANAVQEEIVGVITGAGIALDKQQNNQLALAIGRLIVDALPGLATADDAGLVRVGAGLSVDAEGVLIATGSGSAVPAANAIVKALATGKIDSGWLDFSQLFAGSGWARLPNGLIIQWGLVSNVPSPYGTKAVTFPVAFPAACYTVQLTSHVRGQQGSGLNAPPTQTGFTIVSGSDSTILNFYWLALGS